MESLERHRQTDIICLELIIEFFVYHDFQNTLITLKNEMEKFNYPWPDPLPEAKERIYKHHVPILLKLLDGYDHKQFFEKWSSLIPNEIKSFIDYKKLTIYLYTYFATLKYRENAWEEDEDSSEEYLEMDKSEEEEKSEDISDNTKILQKLDKINGTFIIDRPSNITYLPIVEENVSTEKADEISPNEESKHEDEDSLNKEFDTDSLEENGMHDKNSNQRMSPQNNEPTAMNMFKTFLAENGAEFTNDPEFLPFYALPFVENPKLHPAFTKVFEEKWRDELKETVKKFLIKYSCGIDVVPQLVKLYINNETTANIKAKEEQSHALMEENSKKLKDIKRKFHKLKKDYQKLIGVANELSSSLEKSVQGEAVNLKSTLSNCIKIFPDLFSMNVPPSQEVEKSSWESVSSIGEKRLNYNHIDVKKIKYDLVHETVINKLLLLQALRWAITKSSSDEREHVVSWFCRHDILSLKSNFIIDTLAPASSPHPIQQSVVRILNALSSFSIGRDYISSSGIAVQLLIDIAKQNDLDSVTEDMLIATLQKLSLKRRLVDLMNQNNILEWLLIKLETGPLKKYTLEYCTSLIMNLSIFAEPSFWEFHEQGVHCLIKLLKTPHNQVLEFVCGALYCIVKNDVANIYCKNYGLDKLLTECLNNHRSDNTLEKQIDSLIRLHRGEIPTDSVQLNSSFCSDDDLDDPEELESEIDENDLVKGNPSGVSLLSEQYYLVFTAPSIVGRQNNRSPRF